MREFRQKQGRAGERYWRIEVKGDKVLTEWGAIKNGEHSKHGATGDIPGPKGKEGTKGYYTAEANAKFNADRLIRKKKEEGYVELGDEAGVASKIDFGKPLPKNLAFSKPKNSMDTARMVKLADKEGVVFTRKVNGMAAIVYVNKDGDITIYSRRMEDVTEKFPHIVKEINALGVPSKTILLAEAFMGKGNDKDDFNMMQQIMNAKPDHALAVQKKLGKAHFYVYRAPFWMGQNLEDEMNNCEYLELLEYLFHDHRYDMQYIHHLEVFWGEVEDAKKIALKKGYEGWVAYQTTGELKGRGFSFHGKPDRPSCVWKVKYHSEDDFCARWDPKRTMGGGHCKNGCQCADSKQVQKSVTTGKCAVCGGKMVGDGTFGSGKHTGQVGTFSLYQYTPKGVPVYICEVGTGLSDEQKEQLADVVHYPLCVRIIYDDRRYRAKGDDSNALQFPRVDEIREDKEPSECVNPELVTSS